MLLLVGGVYLNLNSAGAWAQEFCGINFKPCPGSQDIRILSLRLFTRENLFELPNFLKPSSESMISTGFKGGQGCPGCQSMKSPKFNS